jgi:anti-anti-sigma factor
MNITQHPGAGWLELRLAGRLDTTWAAHVSDAIESAVQSGAHQIVLNFARVEYISSLGIRVLLTHFKRLQSVNGRLSVSEPSEATLSILRATGLAAILVSEGVAAEPEPTPETKQLTRGSGNYEIYPQAVSASLNCVAVGHPERLLKSGFAAGDCRPLTFPRGAFGLGLGAFGDGFADCRDRFGEFLAGGGSAITLPTDDAQALPDYVVEQGTFVPRVETLYALVGSGDFPAMIRFDADAESGGKLGLAELVDALFAILGAELVAFAVLAEAAGLVGATLRRSPAVGPLSVELPDVRDCLSFSTERIGRRSLALVVGVASRDMPSAAAEFLRPLDATGAVQAHVHAALFPYRPVQRGELPFSDTVSALLASSTPETVVHLMSDTRPFDGVGETELVRGACWAGPLSAIARQ